MIRWAARAWRLIAVRVARRPALDRSESKGTDEKLRAALAACGFSPRDTRAWILHVRRFCEEHGGEKRYPELLDLTRRCLREIE